MYHTIIPKLGPHIFTYSRTIFDSKLPFYLSPCGNFIFLFFYEQQNFSFSLTFFFFFCISVHCHTSSNFSVACRVIDMLFFFSQLLLPLLPYFLLHLSPPFGISQSTPNSCTTITHPPCVKSINPPTLYNFYIIHLFQHISLPQESSLFQYTPPLYVSF